MSLENLLKLVEDSGMARRRETLEKRIARLTKEGAIAPAAVSPKTKELFPVIARRPGALKRFLASRD